MPLFVELPAVVFPGIHGCASLHTYMAMEALAMAKNNRESRAIAAVNRITPHTTCYISVYIGWSTFDAVNFWCLPLYGSTKDSPTVVYAMFGFCRFI